MARGLRRADDRDRLFLVGSWDAGTPPLWMATVLAIHGFGLALFQVSYMEIVLASSPLADRGVAGSLSMLTRTIGVVTAAALLTLIFHSIEAAAGEAGASADGAFSGRVSRDLSPRRRRGRSDRGGDRVVVQATELKWSCWIGWATNRRATATKSTEPLAPRLDGSLRRASPY
jgi:hypothetical protein